MNAPAAPDCKPRLALVMETSLRYDTTSRSLSLFAKERFTNSEDVVLTVRRDDETHSSDAFRRRRALRIR